MPDLPVVHGYPRARGFPLESAWRVDATAGGARIEGRAKEPVWRPFVSVIVPVYNNAKQLGVCLDALGGQDYRSSRYEVIVIDNGSRDDVGAVVASRPGVRLCREDKPGSYAARNSGVAIAAGEVLAFTDSDCVPAGDWIATGVDALIGSPYADVVGGDIEVFAAHEGPANAFETHQKVKGFYQEQRIRAERQTTTACLFTYRRVFEQVGPFDESLQSGGDGDWCRSAGQAGLQVVFSAQTRLRHPARSTMHDFVMRYVRTTGGIYQRRKKYGMPPLTIAEVFGYLTPPIRETRARATHRALHTTRNKIQFFCVEYLLRMIRVFETLRLMLGGKVVRN